MRLVVVAHSYPRWNGDVAGAFVERLCVALLARSFTPVVVVPADEGSGGSIVLNGIPIRRVRYSLANLETLAYRGQMAESVRSVAGLFSFASLVTCQAAAVFEELRSTDAPLVHAHWWVPGGVSAWLASILSHRRFVVTLHGTDIALLERSKGARRIARLVLRRASGVTAVSTHLAEKVAAVTGLDPEQIVVQPMPLDVDRYARRSRGGGGVVTVGRLVKQKNIAVLLEAMALLKARRSELQLKIVGDGPERRSLQYKAEQLGIAAQTRFEGSVSPEIVPDVIGDADVFVFPAIKEGLGLAAAEALMLGVPVVASVQGGGVTDIVPPEGAGRLVDSADAHQMAYAIEQLLENPASKKLAFEHGEILKSRLSPAAVAAVYERLYTRAMTHD